MRTEEAMVAYLEAKSDYSPRTLDQYSRALEYLERECGELPEIAAELRSALNKLKSAWVRDAHWRVWKSFFNWCSFEYDCPNPMERVEKPKTPEVEMTALELDQLAEVLAAADKLRDKCIVALAMDSGIRSSEFGKLRFSDIGKDTIAVWGKGNKRASVPMSPETRALLVALAGQDGEDQDRYLFLGDKGMPITRFGVYRVVRRCMEKVGVKGVKRGAHCLRHSLGKHYIASGGDSFTLQRILRHRNISTTLKYANLNIDDVVRAHQEHSPLKQFLPGMEPFKDLFVERIAEEKVPPGEMFSQENHGDVEGMAAGMERLRVAHNDTVRLHNELMLHLNDMIQDLALLFESHTHRVDGSILLPDAMVEFLADEVARLEKTVR